MPKDQNKSMGYYNYHAIAMNLIKSNHCKTAIFTEIHGSISPALVLIFDNHDPMPIRKEHFEKYLIVLKTFNVKIENEELFYEL